MSEVISFRLDTSNPREARALEILNAWMEEGYSARFSLTNALIGLGDPSSEQVISQNGIDLELVLNQINRLLDVLRPGESNAVIRHAPEREPNMLQEIFLASIRQAVKPGIKL